jgi:hypothetical protein
MFALRNIYSNAAACLPRRRLARLKAQSTITYANKKELSVLISTNPSTNLIHCIYEMPSKVHGVVAVASQSRWPSDPLDASELA